VPARRSTPGRPTGTRPGRAAQHRVLVAEHDQLSILGQVLAGYQCSEAEYPANQQVDDLEQHPASQPSPRPGCWRWRRSATQSIIRAAHDPGAACSSGQPQVTDPGVASTAAAIRYLTWAISLSLANRVRWWYQRERAWWRRRQVSQCPVARGGGGWVSRRPVSGTVSGIMPGSAGEGWSGRTGAGAWVLVRWRRRAAVMAQVARAAMTSMVCRMIAV
jgi:hypothetical protein